MKLKNLGSPNEEVREQAYRELFAYFSKVDFTVENRKDWLRTLLSNENLFFCSPEGESENSVRRSYTLLILVPLLRTSSQFFVSNPLEQDFAVTSLIDFITIEKDLRGRCEKIGWIHILAHFADVVGVLSSVLANELDLQRLGAALINKISSPGSKALMFDENWRIGIALAHLLLRLGDKSKSITNSLIEMANQLLPLSQNAKWVLRTIYLYLQEKDELSEVRMILRENLS